ncbi:MAG: hypothetical protein HRU19_00835 [Pseudobacteriovorax sp.]|nr:hypothetical protein [Pseudobacteriovorax sp.]
MRFKSLLQISGLIYLLSPTLLANTALKSDIQDWSKISHPESSDRVANFAGESYFSDSLSDSELSVSGYFSLLSGDIEVSANDPEVEIPTDLDISIEGNAFGASAHYGFKTRFGVFRPKLFVAQIDSETKTTREGLSETQGSAATILLPGLYFHRSIGPGLLTVFAGTVSVDTKDKDELTENNVRIDTDYNQLQLGVNYFLGKTQFGIHYRQGVYDEFIVATDENSTSGTEVYQPRSQYFYVKQMIGKNLIVGLGVSTNHNDHVSDEDKGVGGYFNRYRLTAQGAFQNFKTDNEFQWMREKSEGETVIYSLRSTNFWAFNSLELGPSLSYSAVDTKGVFTDTEFVVWDFGLNIRYSI